MSTATYLYCILSASKAPALGRAPAGLPGTGKPRLIDAGEGLWLVAADAPLDQYGEKPIERGLQDLTWVTACAVPHEAVIEHLSKAGTVVPMKLFTLFHSDDRALEHVAKERRRIDKLLLRIAGREEWGLRVTLDEASALHRAQGEAQVASKGAPGAEFLLRKKKQQDAARELLDHARDRASGLFETLTPKADDARRRAPPPGEAGKRVLLDAAFLLRRPKVKSFQSAVRAQAKKLAPLGYKLTLTGPWPPYNFVVDAS